MASYKKYSKYLIATIMVISLGTNIFLAIQLRALKQKMTSSNLVTSTKLESAIRDTMYSIKEVNQKDDEKSMKNLQLSTQQLVLIFNNWVDLNQPKDNLNEPFKKGLSSLELLKNTVVYYLGNQFTNNTRLTHYDTVLLDKIYEKLDRLLVIYSNVEKHTEKIKGADGKGDGGLGQWAENVEEICKLYRHSRVPNEHLNYIDLDTALVKTYKVLPELKNFRGITNIKEPVQVKDGVHYYEVGYYYGEEPAYLIWVDAMDGSLRFYEDYLGEGKGKTISRNDALSIAKDFIDKLEPPPQDAVDSVSIITDEDSGAIIYAFEFIPVFEDITIKSDTINISVSSEGGNIIRYSNSFNGTVMPDTKPAVGLEEIEEKYKDQLVNAEYIGLSIVRSFYTHYNPMVTYNFISTEERNTTRLYFDVVTGNQIYESYSVHQPIHYTATDDY